MSSFWYPYARVKVKGRDGVWTSFSCGSWEVDYMDTFRGGQYKVGDFYSPHLIRSTPHTVTWGPRSTPQCNWSLEQYVSHTKRVKHMCKCNRAAMSICHARPAVHSLTMDPDFEAVCVDALLRVDQGAVRPAGKKLAQG